MRLLGLFFFLIIHNFGALGQTKQWKIGDTLPNFSYEGQFTRDYQLKELQGSYVLVNFWASWNEESRRLQISFIDLFARYKDPICMHQEITRYALAASTWNTFIQGIAA